MALNLFYVIAAVFGSGAAERRLAESDFTPDPNATATLEASNRQLMLDNVHKRIVILRRKLAMPLLSMSSAVLMAWIVGKHFALWRFTGGQLGGMSAFVFAWAGLGRLGYSGQSWDGDTSIERGDDSIFHSLCWLGMYLAAASVL